MTALTEPGAGRLAGPAAAVAALTRPVTGWIAAAPAALLSALAAVRRRSARARAERATVRLLTSLDERVLRDLGIERGQIEPTARALAARHLR
jgi:uncharacterized protein YjiS (DUF1127 family)